MLREFVCWAHRRSFVLRTPAFLLMERATTVVLWNSVVSDASECRWLIVGDKGVVYCPNPAVTRATGAALALLALRAVRSRTARSVAEVPLGAARSRGRHDPQPTDGKKSIITITVITVRAGGRLPLQIVGGNRAERCGLNNLKHSKGRLGGLRLVPGDDMSIIHHMRGHFGSSAAGTTSICPPTQHHTIKYQLSTHNSHLHHT